MIEFIGSSGYKTLFAGEDQGVVVDAEENRIIEFGDVSVLTNSEDWEISETFTFNIAEELANAALTDLDITVLSASDRMFTIPDGVISEAKRGIEWRKEEKRGGTSVGLNTARTLAKGGQIGIKKVRHIAKYFPRHEVDKKAKGYKPGEDGYPSNGRIAWALWGGDAGQRWASRIVESDNKKEKSVSAGGYDSEARIDFSSFNEVAQFHVRIRLDGSGIDRLYRVSSSGVCHVWDDGCWDDMGNIAHDFFTFDKALDDVYDTCGKLHIPVDVKTAIVVSAMFDNNPFTFVKLHEIEPEETSLFEKSIAELDWDVFDQLSDDEVEDDHSWDDGLVAALTEFAEEPDLTPGVYTDEERSENAAQQVRDKFGRFAQNGSRVVIGGDYNYQGVITGQNPEAGTVSVQLDNGNTVDVPGNTTQEISTFEPVSTSNFPTTNLDFTGILGEPRVPIDQPLAQLPGRLPPLTAPETNLLVNDWGSWVAGQRLSPEYAGDPLPPFVPRAVPDINTAMGRFYQGAFNPDGTTRPGWNPAVAQNVYNEPLLRDWLDERYANQSGEVGYHNRGWYTPPRTTTPVEAKKPRSQVYDPTNVAYWNDRFNPVNFSITAALDDQKLTPETSDVPVMYLAIVAEDDPQAVMDLIALVPSSKTSTAPIAYRREPGEWAVDTQIVSDLKSATPPPVIVLSNELLSEVVEQIDSIQASARLPHLLGLTDNAVIRALVSAGGLDRNRGNAEKLRRYWTKGKGALKIRWNTPGDWTRCYRNLAKYMGPRAKGYCALRHKEMTGVWPGSSKNIGKKKKALRSSGELGTLKTENQIISDFTLRARAESARSRMVGRDGVSPSQHGAPFVIPLVIPENVETGDGRIFKKESITIRELPLPLLWQIKTGQGHDGSVVVGQITYMERTTEGIGNAYGVFDTGAYGREAERLVRHGFIRGVSADMDKFETDDEITEDENGQKSEDSNPSKINIKSARVMAVTIVPKPAFQECFIQIVGGAEESHQKEAMTPDGIYVDEIDPLGASALVACGIVAGAIPLTPPASWFENPKLQGPTPLTLDDDGRVYGHIAAWHVDHIGMAFGTRPPRSRSKYAYFHTGALRTEDGKDVPVGQLTLAGGHAGLEASAQEAVRHYDDTASAFADVHAGEDAFGIWVAGSLRPGTTPEQIRAARASAPSGDWRPINGRLELVAVCQVNVPGFPIARARVASGQVMALVAAGANVLAQMKHDPLAELNQKVDAVLAQQNQPYIQKAAELTSRFKEMSSSIYSEKAAELASRVKKAKEDDSWDYMIQMMDDDPESEMGVVPRRTRQRLAREGKAMPDGSFPIRNIADLRNAVQAYGRAKPGSKGAVRKHIIKRAKSLKREDIVPAKWSTQFNEQGEELSLRDRALAAAAKITEVKAVFEVDQEDISKLDPEEIRVIKQLPKRDEDGRIKYTPETQPRDNKGRFRQVLARLKLDLGDSGLQDVVEKVEEAENLAFAGDYEKASSSAAALIGLLERLDTGALNKEALENVKASAAELGGVIANLPLAFGEDAQKIRFSDIPPALQNLMKEMITRVEEKIGQEDADEATQKLKGFLSGSDLFSQAEISSEMSTLLRLLT
jgi:hypothetical protein